MSEANDVPSIAPGSPSIPGQESSVADETAAMTICHDALSALDKKAQVRVMRWLASKVELQNSPLY